MFECVDTDLSLADEVSARLTIPVAEPKKGTEVRERVLFALRSEGDYELADLFERCNPREYCRLYYCEKCRWRWVNSHSNRIMETRKAYYNDTPYGDTLAKRHIRHVTGLRALVPLDFRKIRTVLKDEKKAFKSFSASFKRVAVRGFFEIELIHAPLMFEAAACPQKQRTLIEMTNGDVLECTEIMALVHFHALMFFHGGTGEEERIERWLKSRYPHHRQYDFGRLWQAEEHKVEDSLRKLAGYPFKDRHRYNLKFKTDGYQDGPYIGPKELAFLVRLNHEFPINEMKISLR